MVFPSHTPCSCVGLMQVPADVVCAIDELRKTTHACFSASSKSLQHQILDQAFAQ